MATLPKPDCKWGYTSDQIDDIMPGRRAEFDEWMVGQTASICEAIQYNYNVGGYEPNGCEVPHGRVTYPHDVERFLRGLTVID